MCSNVLISLSKKIKRKKRKRKILSEDQSLTPYCRLIWTCECTTDGTMEPQANAMFELDV